MADLEKIVEETTEIPETEKYKLYTGKIKAFKEMLKFLPASYVKKLANADKLNDVAKSVKNTIERGAVGFPRICSTCCEMAPICPFAKTEIFPEGEMCPIESAMMNNIAEGLQEELIADRGKITMADNIQIFMIAAAQTMLSYRIAGLIGLKGSTTVEVRQGPGGMKSETEIPNPLIESYVMLNDTISKHLRALHLTRIERSKTRPSKEQTDDKLKELDGNRFITLLQESGISIDVISNIMRRLQDENHEPTKESIKDDSDSTSDDAQQTD